MWLRFRLFRSSARQLARKMFQSGRRYRLSRAVQPLALVRALEALDRAITPETAAFLVLYLCALNSKEMALQLK